MKILVVTVASHPHPNLDRLERSLDRFGWKHVHLRRHWLGFKTKLMGVRDYAPVAREGGFDWLIHLDSWDSLAIGNQADFENGLQQIGFTGKALISCERACWPDADREKDYPATKKSPWCHINSGHYLVHVDYAPVLLSGCEHCDDDQRLLTTRYLDDVATNKGDVWRDDGCSVFQSLAHQHVWQDAFEIRGDELWNHVTGTKIVFAHANGGGSASNYYSWVPGFEK